MSTNPMDEPVYFNGDIITQKEAFVKTISMTMDMMRVIYDEAIAKDFTPHQAMTFAAEFMCSMFGCNSATNKKGEK